MAEGTFTVTVSDNETGTERTGTIVVNAGTANEQTVTVTQAARDTLTVSPDTLTFGYNDTDSQTVMVTTTADSYTATSSQDWATITQSDGSFEIKVSENNTGASRTATITVNAGTANEATVTVTQNAQDTLTVDPTSLTFTAVPDGAQSVSVTTSADSFTATPSQDWITATVDVEALAAHITVDTHQGEEHKNGSVVFNAGTCHPIEVSVLQTADKKSNYLNVSQTNLNFSYDAPNDERTITVDTSSSWWNAFPENEWIKVEVKNTTTFTVKVETNTTGDYREGSVTVVGDSVETTIRVKQEKNW